jgi:hypothetical protein
LRCPALKLLYRINFLRLDAGKEGQIAPLR